MMRFQAKCSHSPGSTFAVVVIVIIHFCIFIFWENCRNFFRIPWFFVDFFIKKFRTYADDSTKSSIWLSKIFSHFCKTSTVSPIHQFVLLQYCPCLHLDCLAFFFCFGSGSRLSALQGKASPVSWSIQTRSIQLKRTKFLANYWLGFVVKTIQLAR